MYEIKQGDCIELMKNLPNKSIDMILCDLPYGTTKNKWDFVFVENDGEVSIIYKEMDSEPKIINWYKLTHVGRCLNLWGFKNVEELENILDDLDDDLKRIKGDEE